MSVIVFLSLGILDKTRPAAKYFIASFIGKPCIGDVKEYCRQCEKCQKCSTKKPPNVPLIPLSIISEPFKRIAMDIVSPLSRSRSGKRYVLVVCDYATRYPKAIALKDITTETVVEEPIKLFSRVGIPEEIFDRPRNEFHIRASQRTLSIASYQQYSN